MSAPDNPGTAVRPPRLYLGVLAAGLVLDYLLPLPVRIALPLRLAGIVPVVAGLALALWAFRHFSRAGTNVPTVLPSTALVTVGPYGHSRNPIYVGMTAIYLGLALAFASPWALVLLPAVLAVMEIGVIRREELYLENRFGEPYRAYRQRVRRWL